MREYKSVAEMRLFFTARHNLIGKLPAPSHKRNVTTKWPTVRLIEAGELP
jgi:hypothetical protein